MCSYVPYKPKKFSRKPRRQNPKSRKMGYWEEKRGPQNIKTPNL